MSITLSIPPAVVREVREWAEANGTSLNQYVRDCLQAKCDEIAASRRRLAQQFLEFARTHTAHAPKGWKFNRERDGHREIKIRVGKRRNTAFSSTTRSSCLPRRSSAATRY